MTDTKWTRSVNLLKKASSIIDSAIELPYAISACVELAREVRTSREHTEKEFRFTSEAECLLKGMRVELSGAERALGLVIEERDELRAELERVQLALGKATEELTERKNQVELLQHDNRDLLNWKRDMAETMGELNETNTALAHKLDWLTRWREGACPFPNGTPVIRHTPIEKLLPSEEWFVYPWRPANLDLYEEFRDA